MSYLHDQKYGHGGRMPSSIMDREAHADQKMVDLMRRIEEQDLGISLRDVLTEDVSRTRYNPFSVTESDVFNRLSQDDLRELKASGHGPQLLREAPMETTINPWDGIEGGSGMYHSGSGRQFLTSKPAQRQPQKRVITEDDYEEYQNYNRNGSTDWQTAKLSAKLTSGDVVPVWKVINKKTKMTMETVFRIEEIADRIAHVLNESGNVNDPRILSVTTAYKKRNALLKAIKETKLQLREANKPMKSMRLTQLQEELEVVNYKLGL